MAEPARRNADGPALDDPERKPDPRSCCWADVRQALVAGVAAWHLAVEELAAAATASAGDPDAKIARAALEMVRLTGGVVESLGVIAARWQLDEAIVEAVRERAYAQGAADCKAARCRLEVIDGGQAG